MEFLSFSPHYFDGDRPQISVKSLLQAAYQPKETGMNVFTCLSCGGAKRRLKVGWVTCPVAAASQIVITRWQTAHHSNRAWAYRMSIKKLGPAPGIKFCGPGPQVKRFLHR
jgi:hypothetical protein